MICVTEFEVLGKNLPIYEVRKNDFPDGGILKIFFLDHFSQSFRPKIVILDTDTILRVKRMVEYQPYCVLILVLVLIFIFIFPERDVCCHSKD